MYQANDSIFKRYNNIFDSMYLIWRNYRIISTFYQNAHTVPHDISLSFYQTFYPLHISCSFRGFHLNRYHFLCGTIESLFVFLWFALVLSIWWSQSMSPEIGNHAKTTNCKKDQVIELNSICMRWGLDLLTFSMVIPRFHSFIDFLMNVFRFNKTSPTNPSFHS